MTNTTTYTKKEIDTIIYALAKITSRDLPDLRKMMVTDETGLNRDFSVERTLLIQGKLAALVEYLKRRQDIEERTAKEEAKDK